MSKIVTQSAEIKKNQLKAVLKEATLYQSSNTLQRHDAKDVLDEYSSRMKWKDGARILDVGCGDGGVTVHVLKPNLPENFHRLIGCDIGPEMITHANLHHKTDRIEFKVMDIATSSMDSVGQFDHVFSFYALHWIQEQEKALANIHSLLEPGGDCLLAFLGHIPIYDIYRMLALNPMWTEYMFDLDKYISPYHDSQYPEEEFRILMEKSGFKDVDVQCKNKVYMFEGIDVLKKALRAVNPFIHRLTPVLRERFLEDYMDILRNKQLVEEFASPDGKSAKIKTCYSLIVAYAVK